MVDSSRGGNRSGMAKKSLDVNDMKKLVDKRIKELHEELDRWYGAREWLEDVEHNGELGLVIAEMKER